MIQLDNITKVFHPGTVNENLAMNNLSLKVNQGDFITIIGSNGAGKSTLFNLIAGSFPVSSGKIRISGRDVTRDPEYKRAKYIGRIFQNPLLGTAGNMSIEHNMMICHKKGFKGLKVSLNSKMRREFAEHLEVLGMNLENRLGDSVGLLSGGQRQAMTLLMMVMSRPDLVLLDEHTAALDPAMAQIVMDLTRRFISEYNLTAMMITHNMAHAIEYGNRLLMMDKGEIILDISGEEKRNLTPQKLIDEFQKIRHKSFDNDKVLLAEAE